MEEKGMQTLHTPCITIILLGYIISIGEYLSFNRYTFG